jgi:nicotinate-nucleotide--dimethylbenzimidazole phosphoribosyltransferase
MFNLPAIPVPHTDAAEKARNRQAQLTKPAGSMGRLEDLSIQLASICGRIDPDLSRKAVVVMAGDHGIAREGVSAYPPEVTPQMVLNFVRGGAAINVLARQAGARVSVVDMGVAYDFPLGSGVIDRKIARGTRNMAVGAAMNREQAQQAIIAGIEIAWQEIDKGLDLLATGDMGIGNTTPSSAIAAVFTGESVSRVTGRGTGVDDNGLAAKIAIIEKSLQINQPNKNDPLDVLAKVGGFEIGGLAGLIIGGASKGIPVVVDGFISTAAALLAVELVPDVRPYLISAHRSVEIGQRAMLEKIGIEPLMDLNLRLGEGTGAVLAFHLIEVAVLLLNEMATFDDAGVTNKE